MKARRLVGFVVMLAPLGCGHERELTSLFSPEQWEKVLELSPPELPTNPPDVSNAFADDPAAATFGQRLFFDTRFSGALMDGDNDGSEHALGHFGETGKVSCAGCHVPTSGFSDTRTLGGAISLGSGWGRRRTPSLLDIGQTKIIMWDGRHDALFNQVFGPIESPVEMNSSRLYAAKQVFVNHRAEYEAIFGALPPLDDTSRFPNLPASLTGCQHTNDSETPPVCDGTRHGMPGDGAEYDSMSPSDQEAVTRVVVNLGKALGAYQRLLTCGQGRFDAWVHERGERLSEQEQRGLALFVGKAECTSCHSGPFFSDQQFHNVGLWPQRVSVVFLALDDPGALRGVADAIADPLNVRGQFSDGDDGRLPESVDPALEGAFRTPTLRCVDTRPRFMHTGHMFDLEEVLSFKNRGGDDGGFRGTKEIAPLGLSNTEKADLVAFLKTLRGPGPDEALLSPPQ